ncbi:MAG: peptidase, partial [Clostridia bacterium]|nr:peptidase [Clostridia bacterium]
MPNPPKKMPQIPLTDAEQAYMPIADRFTSAVYETGEHQLDYNLFIPADTDHPLPLVVFMHDMGSVSDQPDRALHQGIGALVWASDEDQAARPCYVLAPQYREQQAFDDFTVGWAAEATISLIHHLCDTLNIDRNRIYGTGQSMGTMMLSELMLRHPGFFAGCFLTAGQWDPERMGAIRHEHVWIMVSEKDDKAFPIMGACMQAVEKAGCPVARGHVNAKADESIRAEFCRQVLSQGCTIQFTWLDGDSVLPEGTEIFPAVYHMHTWKWAY